MSLLNFVSDNKAMLLIGGGIGTMLTGGILACRSTFKLSPILEEHMDVMNNISDLEETVDDYNDGSHDRKVCYFKTIKKITKLYLIPTTVTAIGVIMILAGTKNITDQNAQLSAAVTTGMAAFNEYRDRVVDRFGEEVDKELRAGVKEVEVEETDEKGKKKKAKHKVADLNAKGRGWGFYITPSNPLYNKDKIQMMATFNREKAYCNNLFHANKKFVVEQMYERFCVLVDDLDNADIMIMGWCDGVGDQFIDFTIEEVKTMNSLGGIETSYFIDPNVQCNVHKELRKRKVETLKKFGKEADAA